MAEIEMEQHGPTEANAIKHFSENVHNSMLVGWTVRHNIQTMGAIVRETLRLKVEMSFANSHAKRTRVARFAAAP